MVYVLFRIFVTRTFYFILFALTLFLNICLRCYLYYCRCLLYLVLMFFLLMLLFLLCLVSYHFVDVVVFLKCDLFLQTSVVCAVH